jgi:hypothetical protein
MNRKVRKASQALNAAREAYKKAGEDLLAAVEATPAEIEEAYKIICEDLDFDRIEPQLPNDSLHYDEDIAYAILEELRGEKLP